MSNQQVNQQAMSLNPSGLVTLYVLDATKQGGGVYRYSPGAASGGGAIVWQGESYPPYPMQASGFEFSVTGSLPRPTVKFGNVLNAFTALCMEFNDLIGAKLVRRRTYARFLDNGPAPDPTVALPDDVFTIMTKTSEQPDYVEFELATAFDVDGVKLPRRICSSSNCSWKYRGGECQYRAPGALFTNRDFPTYLAGGVPVNQQWRGNWNNTTPYRLHDAVTVADGSPVTGPSGEAYQPYKWYVALSANTGTAVTNGAVWQLFQSYKGEWDASLTYAAGDSVSVKLISDGRLSFFVANQAVAPDTTPPANNYKFDTDQCSKTVTGCQVRFGYFPANGLPYGAFLGTQAYDQITS